MLIYSEKERKRKRCLYFKYSPVLRRPRWLSFVSPPPPCLVRLRGPVFYLSALLFSFPPISPSFRQVSTPKTSIFPPQFGREKVHLHFLLLSSVSHQHQRVCVCVSVCSPPSPPQPVAFVLYFVAVSSGRYHN